MLQTSQTSQGWKVWGSFVAYCKSGRPDRPKVTMPFLSGIRFLQFIRYTPNIYLYLQQVFFTFKSLMRYKLSSRIL